MNSIRFGSLTTVTAAATAANGPAMGLGIPLATIGGVYAYKKYKKSNPVPVYQTPIQADSYAHDAH